MCLAQRPQRSDPGEARTQSPSVLSQALYHWAKMSKWNAKSFEFGNWHIKVKKQSFLTCESVVRGV